MRRYGIDCDFERTGELDGRHRAPPGRASSPRTASRARRRGHDVRAARRRRRARAGGLADVPRRAAATRTAPRWSTRPGWPGACARPACAWACGSTSTPAVTGLAGGRRRRRRCATPRRRGAARAGWCWRPTPSRPLLRRLRLMTVPVYDYALMTEPLSPDAARRDRLAEPAGHRRRGATCSTTTGSPATTGSCGAATTRSTTTAAGCDRGLRAARRRPIDAARRALLHDLPAARGAAVHATAGAA